MKKAFILLIISFLFSNLNAQDIIFKNNGDEIQVKVLEITPDIVKYKIYSSQDGPIYSIYKSDVLLIKYEDGRKDVFKNNSNLGTENNEITFIDNRDGLQYKMIKIGKQVWMTENLNYRMDESYCYEEKSEYCKKYGRLYSWEAATNACPDGWHLPSDEEWKELEVELGMQNDVDNEGWRGKSPGQGFLLKKGGGSGFNAELAGYAYIFTGKYFEMVDDEGYFWTSTKIIERNKQSWYRHLTKRASIERKHINNKHYYMSVRCIKNN